jgi:hypothetical protein
MDIRERSSIGSVRESELSIVCAEQSMDQED